MDGLIRIGEVLTGPLAVVLQFFGVIPLAGFSFLIGAFVSLELTKSRQEKFRLRFGICFAAERYQRDNGGLSRKGESPSLLQWHRKILRMHRSNR